ncbi:hypothetical protein HZY97_05160 [Sphingomonas sp. R-74633]|nr:hypothetical protein [Sphingomonas sp. R-74633]
MLAGVIGLILCGYGWWFFAPHRMVAPELEVETSRMAVVPPGGEAEFERLPLFVPATGDWLVDGKRVRSIASRTVGLDHRQPPDDSVFQKIVPIRLPAPADRATMQRALVALATDGVCQVALVEKVGSDDLLVLIRRFTDASGVSRPCRDRLNKP